jgi:hypothetical protein
MPNELQPPPEGHVSPFERIRRTNAAGVEFWSSREFAQVLGYADYRNFEQVVQKARTACFNSAHPIEDHFVDITEMVGFQNHGYMGLYGGLDMRGIHARKGLKKSQQILDHMGSTELAANLFRATQTEEKLRRENTRGKARANQMHREVGAKVRQTIKELGGTMPEDLPAVESIKKLEAQQRKQLKKRKPDDKQ